MSQTREANPISMIVINSKPSGDNLTDVNDIHPWNPQSSVNSHFVFLIVEMKLSSVFNYTIVLPTVPEK